MNDKFLFLTSVRFWKLFLIGASASLETFTKTNDWHLALLAGLSIWLGGSVVVGTVDKATASD